jgi:hypothetical protein
MSRTFHHGERRIRVRGVRRHPADLRRLAKALIALAQADAEATAQAAHESPCQQAVPSRSNQPKRTSGGRGA